jgi:DNA replication protein DnaC
MSDTAQAAVIQEHCKELKLAAVVRDYPALCRQARDGGWAYEDLLRELLEAEVTNRRQSTARRLLREARFPDVKTLEQIDWPALKGVSRPKISERIVYVAARPLIVGMLGYAVTRHAGD